jgi:hypothetical protein
LTLLTPAEPGRRNRRTIDAIFLGLASLVTGLTAVVARMAPDVDAEVADAIGAVLGWAPNLWRAAYVLAIANAPIRLFHWLSSAQFVQA